MNPILLINVDQEITKTWIISDEFGTTEHVSNEINQDISGRPYTLHKKHFPILLQLKE